MGGGENSPMPPIWRATGTSETITEETLSKPKQSDPPEPERYSQF